MSARGSWGVLAAVALALAPLWFGPARAQNVPAPEPLIAPDEMLAVDQVRPGMKGYGRSVFSGTKIERFNVTVIGVLRKIDYGGDMVLVRIDDGYPVTSGSGISQGMSGSPIYVNDKLVGALAFAWPFAKDPVAGVTPIAQMLENYRPGAAPPAPVVAKGGDLQPVGGPLTLDGKLFARATVVPEKGMARPGYDGTLYLAPVPTPIMVSGAGRGAMDAMRRGMGRYAPTMFQGPGHADLPPAERPKIEPGSAVGVQLLGGDVDATAIGTVTYVKGDHVLAFGHPMFGLGSIDMPMTTAFIHGIISSQEVSFKMGSPVETVGHITQDRNWSIGGQLGTPSKSIDAEFVITDRERGVKRDYRLRAAVQRDLTPSLLYGSLMNAVQSVSPPNTGTTRGTVEVWPQGMPPIRRENVFATGERRSQLEQLLGDPLAGMPMAELLQIMQVLETNTFGSVPIERIKVTVEVSEKRSTATIERAYADRKRVKPGDRIKLGVVLQPANAPKEVREFEVEIPRNIPGGKLSIGVSSGGSAERVRQALQVTRPTAKTLPQILEQIANREQNDQLVIEIAQPVVGVAVSGRELPNLPNVVVEVLTSANPGGIRAIRSHTRTTYPTPWVLSGAQVLTLEVDADEKDKAGPSLLPGAAGLGITSIFDLFRTGLGGDLGTDFSGDPEPGDGGLGGLEGGPDEDSQSMFGLPGFRNLAAAQRPAPAPPMEPAMPSFEELQQILEGDGSGGVSKSASSSPTQKGLARTPGVWKMSTAKDFQGGKLDGVLVSSRGELALAPPAASLLTSPDRLFWAQTADPSGNVYVGSWLDGNIVKIGADGKPAEFFAGTGEIAISALTCDSSGTLYAAAEPSGTIYRIGPDGTGARLCTLPNERVWVLRKMGDDLYAGTGSEGRLYRITPDGKATAVFTAPDRHVYALVDDGAGGLYCGTYPRGKIFHVKDGKATPIYELPSQTVSALARDSQGNLYVGTSPLASVVKITPAGDASVIFQSKEHHVFSLLLDGTGSVYAGVGSPARVYRISPDRTVSTLWEPQAAYVLSLSQDASGNLFATTAGPTQIVRLPARPGAAGTFTSPVLNAGNLARWGVARWAGTPGGIEVRTRSGSTAYPDATWSDWSTPLEKATGEAVRSPGGQYLQYRVTLRAAPGQAAPSLRNLELFYRARNRAPEVTVKAPAGGDVLSGSREIRWEGKDPDSDRLSYDVYYAKEGTKQWVKIGSRTGRPADSEPSAVDLQSGAIRPAHPKNVRLVARREALPPTRAIAPINRRVAVSRQPAQRSPKPAAPATVHPAPAVSSAEKLDMKPESTDEEFDDAGTSLDWDTRRVPDGRYRLKIVVSDAASSPDEPLAGEIVSDAVLVDNTAPRLQLQAAKRIGTAPPSEISVQDAGNYVASAEYRVDGGAWLAAAAADGIFDSADEVIRLDPTRLPAGKHTLEIRVRDAAGNESGSKLPYRTTGPATTAPARGTGK